MPIHFTVDRAVSWCVDQLLSRQQLTETRKNEIRSATKYNLLVISFNSSTVALVASVFFAIFFTYTVSFILLTSGLFIRFTTEKEIQKYTLPLRQDEAEEPGMAAAMWDRLWATFTSAMLRHALHQATPEEKIANIFQNVHLPLQANWEPDEVVVFDYPFWKNPIEIPPPLQSEENPIPSPVSANGGILSGLMQRITG